METFHLIANSFPYSLWDLFISFFCFQAIPFGTPKRSLSSILPFDHYADISPRYVKSAQEVMSNNGE
jgi:hypothetical protein